MAVYVAVAFVSDFDRRELDQLSDKTYRSESEIFDECVKLYGKKRKDQIMIYSMSEFVELCNDQELNLDEVWLGYAEVDGRGK